jgi:membrane-bound lytic murein transglycosylase A
MLGRYDEGGEFVLYDERAQIMSGSLEGRAPIIAYAADPVEFFFLQIQGSGLLRLPDGSLMRIGYAGQNGRGYTGIGRVLRENGQIGPGTPYATSMQGIMQFIRENPEEGEEVMNLNKSWIFFRELDTDGPLGSLEVPVYARDSVAVDPRFVPYGAPVWLDLERDVADGLWIAQDTGGAIKGANRFDTFWGAGPQAREIAGGMSARGNALVLLPKSAAARLDSAR